MKKKSVKKLMDIMCPKCGRITHHYLNDGEYRCVVCQSVNKTIKVKPKKEVVFEMDPELDATLNPDPVEKILQNAGTEMTSEGPILDDQGNPV